MPGSYRSVTTFVSNRSLVIRQKGESQNGRFRKTKHVKFSEKRTFLAHTHIIQYDDSIG